MANSDLMKFFPIKHNDDFSNIEDIKIFMYTLQVNLALLGIPIIDQPKTIPVDKVSILENTDQHKFTILSKIGENFYKKLLVSVTIKSGRYSAAIFIGDNPLTQNWTEALNVKNTINLEEFNILFPVLAENMK